jgi:hypothetical protein
MSNQIRNAQAVLIHRPVITGQVRGTRGMLPEVEAAINGIIFAVFGIDLLPPCNPAAMWQGKRVV